MDDVIAVAAELADGSCRYFVTWGRIQDVVDPEPVCKVLEPIARRCVRGELVRLRVCETLREAAESAEAPTSSRRSRAIPLARSRLGMAMRNGAPGLRLSLNSPIRREGESAGWDCCW